MEINTIKDKIKVIHFILYDQLGTYYKIKYRY